MNNSKKHKTATLDTTTLIIDFQNSDFQKLTSQLQIWEYILPKHIPTTGSDYTKLHIWARNETNKPYYLHAQTFRLYVIYEVKENVEELLWGEQQLDKKQLSDLYKQDILHCILKVLMAHFVHQTQKFVSNNNFYLLVKTYSSGKGNSYADVLKISPKLNIQKDSDNRENGLFELLVSDTGTRLKRNEFSKRDQRKVPFSFVELPNGQISFKQLKTKGIEQDQLIYEENTSVDHKTKIRFHSIESVEAYEKSRNYLLETFCKGFLNYLQALGFNVSTKQLHLEQKEKHLNEKILSYQRFDIKVIDKRFNQNQSFLSIINLLNKTEYGIKFIASTESKAEKDDVVLILMDYSQGDCEQDGVLPNRIEDDGYKIIKKTGFTISQGFCINKNTFLKKDEKLSLSENDFLKYEDVEVKYNSFVNENLKRNFEICLQQLYLKNLIVKSINVQEKLPHFNLIKNLAFIHCFTKNNQRYNYLCYVENEQLCFESNLGSEKSLSILNRFEIEGIEEVVSFRKSYDQYLKFDTGNIYIILSKEFIWEIYEISEKVLYPSKVHDVLLKRELQKNKYEFELDKDCEVFSNTTSQNYNTYLASQVDDFISFEKLVEKKYYREKIFEILNIKNEIDLAKALKFEGKKTGFFATSQGIWFDKIHTQYFVGNKHSYVDYRQENGFTLRKIGVLKGKFNKEIFFPLLNVDFVKYKGFTIYPYIFRLIKIHHDLNNS
ncbi:hypothetical protein [Emticicia agri]|uniref:Uncharacterized protein n=1 Tax=Emticicia agri TaxID=2492393 RepID=A0A4Q5LQP2_9BACT|nr:hypothetical protein [Emticicia agri]RYU91808.1 hypothetical protein EWM59_26635 [Emticicia agri]